MSFNRTPKALPSIFIYKEDVNNRVKQFDAAKRDILSESMGKDESRASWYSLEQMEEIMKELYYLNADGVRIYFGAYDPEHEIYANQLCLVFVPTCSIKKEGDSEKVIHRDLIIDLEDNFQDRLKISEIKNLNFGALCKPDCDNQELLYPDNSL